MVFVRAKSGPPNIGDPPRRINYEKGEELSIAEDAIEDF